MALPSQAKCNRFPVLLIHPMMNPERGEKISLNIHNAFFAAQKSWASLIATFLFCNENIYTNKTFDIIIPSTEKCNI